MSTIESFGASHVGLVREENQDSVLLQPPRDEASMKLGHLYGIADGMGGYSHGRVASNLALTKFFQTFNEADSDSVAGKLRVGVKIANLEVLQEAQRLGAVRMGTTLTVTHILGNRLTIAHVGDSRVYLIRKRKAVCLTNDHSKVGQLVRMRLLAPEKLRHHYQRSLLTRSIGFDLFVQPDIETSTIQAGDVILLCTDGVWCVIEEHEFADLCSRNSSAEMIANRILELALERESDDNISVVVLRVREVDDQPESNARRWNFLKLIRG